MVSKIFSIPLMLLRHPFNGFYALKHDKLGKKRSIIINLLVFWLCYSIRNQYSSILVGNVNLRFVNSLIDLLGIVTIFLLWCVGNWSITSLVDGEGTFYEIAIATSYALVPMMFVFVPATILSNFLTLEEAAFYSLAISISIVWSAFLLFVAILNVHNFTVAKTIFTIILTFISILIMIFLFLLMAALLQQLWIFCVSVYTELAYS